MRSSAVKQGLVLLLLLGSVGVNAEGILDRWKGGKPRPAPPTEGPGAVPPPMPKKPDIDIGDEYTANRTLTAGQKVSAAACASSPRACTCPPGTVKNVFWEADPGTKILRHKLTCSAVAKTNSCKEGKELFTKYISKTGQVTYGCRKVRY